MRAARASGRTLLAAGAGTGIVAGAAESGGADLICVYSSGRFRRAGLSSLSALLPFANANELVLELVPEIVAAVDQAPVLAGVCATDPFLDLDGHVARLRRMGVAAVQNFPTIGLFDERFRDDLEATGISFEREAELMRAAQRAGLLACGFVTTPDDARRMALAGADVIAPLLGVTRGEQPGEALVRAADALQRMASAAAEVRDDVLVLFHGGPASTAADVTAVLARAPGVHGFFAASSVERQPVERAVRDAARSFVGSALEYGADGPDFATPPPELPLELTTETLPAYLKGRGIVADGDSIEVEELGGGLSNVVLAWRGAGRSGVVKQSRPKLRVADEWRADVRRVLNERDAIAVLALRLQTGRMPEITFSDDDLFAFGMNRLPDDAVLWKPELLAGRLDPARARQAGALLREIHDCTRDDPDVAARFVARPLLDQNRLDPWYRAAAAKHPDLAPIFEYAIERLLMVRRVLVHGDFVPKNIFLVDGSLVLLDLEVAHFGNPGYDIATFINHMLLKGFRFPERADDFCLLAEAMWDEYASPGDGDEALVEHEALLQLGALMLARIDGKSKVEYLVDHPAADDARRFGRWLLRSRPISLREVFGRFRSAQAGG
jgi:predicted TIM-barrel enzyme